MIKGIIIVNNHGKARIVKLYEAVPRGQRERTIKEIFQVVSKRSDNLCNFVETKQVSAWGADTKIIYRHYATLYFIFIVDKSESELGILDLIQVFVEALDKCFENVCELDLIFNGPKVHNILDEIVMGGMVLETSSLKILRAIRDMNTLEKRSTPVGRGSTTKMQARRGGQHRDAPGRRRG